MKKFYSDSPMQRANQEKVLSTLVMTSEGVKSRKEVIELDVMGGAYVMHVERIDKNEIEKIKRELVATQRKFPVCNKKHPRSIRVAELKERLKKPIVKKERRLVLADGSFKSEQDITKTGMDYAAFLIGEQVGVNGEC